LFSCEALHVFFFHFSFFIYPLVPAMSNAKSSSSAISSIYFTSWQYVRIGGFDLRNMGSAGASMAWVDPRGRVLRTPCDSMGEGGDDSYRRPSNHLLDDGIRCVSYAPRGIRLVARQPDRVRFDDPLGMDPEGSPVPVTIVFDEGRYKCWYAFLPARRPRQFPFHQFNQYVCYAESSDGFAWSKPKLGLVEYEGSRDNNIVMSPHEPAGCPRAIFGPGVYVDDCGDPAERYKMIYYGRFSPEDYAAYRKKYPGETETWGFTTEAWGLGGAVSPDGIHWRLLDEPMLIHFTDIIWGSMTFDPQRRKYICYHRTWPKPALSPESFLLIGKRSVARATSASFRHWENSEVLITTGADVQPSHVYYAPGQTWLPGCTDQQVLFVFRWKQEDDTEDLCLFSTPDGWAWSPVPGGSPIMTAGQPGTWEGSYFLGGGYLVELPGSRWALPYMGFPIPHKYPRIAPARRRLHTGVEAHRGYAIWPKGRLVALDCPDEGSFATVAVQPAGQRLFINAAVDPTGFIKIGLKVPGADVPGRSLEDCHPISAKDALEIPVSWRGEDALKTDGQPVIMVFQLRRAKLFGISFR